MKKHLSLRCAILASAILASLPAANAANKVWSAASGTDTNWSNAANWSPTGAPGTSDDALFFDPGATNENVDPTSVVDSSRTVHALRFGQTNNLEIHNLFISPGVTLSVVGTNDNGFGPLGIDNVTGSNGFSTIFAGPWIGGGTTTANVLLTNTISGPGALVVNNTNNEMQVRYSNNQNTPHYSILDMSGLGTFQANLGRIGVGFGQAGITVRSMGRLLLAQTNILTLSGPSSKDDVQLIIGSNNGNNDGNSTTAFLQLGQSNRINVDKVLAGGQKTPGQIIFNTNFANPTLVMRASDGVSRVANLRLGDESDSGATGSPCTGTLNLFAGTSDLLIDTLTIGKSQNGNNTAVATGNLLMGTGNLNVNTLEMAIQANSGFGGSVVGNATFSNSTVTVNTLLNLGVSAGAPGGRIVNLNFFSNSTMTVAGAYKSQGTVNMFITNSTVTMPAGSFLLASNLQVDGGTLANAGTIKATNALNVYNGGTIAGTPVLDLGNGAATWDVQAVAGGSLTVNNALQGKGTINGNIVQAPGATISPGGVNTAGTLSIFGTSGNLTLNDGGTLNFDLSTSGGGINDQIVSGGTVTLNGTNNVFLKSLGGSLDTTTPYTLITAATLTGNQTQFKVVGPLTTGRYTFAFDTTSVANTVRLVVGGTGPANQTWVGDGTANVWDAQGAFNWNNGASSQFFNLDNVTFSDTGSDTPPIKVTGALVTGSLTVNNTARNYSFGGSGSLTVAGQLAKSGTGSLTISNLSDNSFSSVMTVSNGAVTLANNGQNTLLGGLNIFGGSVALSGNSSNVFVDPGLGVPVITVGTGTTLTIANNANTFNGVQMQLDGTLTFNQSADSTFDAVLIDNGTLIKNGANKLTLAGNNGSYGGVMQIAAGTAIAGSVGSPFGFVGATVANGAALDINGKNIGTITVTVAGAGPTGAGALVNNSGPQNTSITASSGGLQTVVMSTNTTFGGTGPFNTDPIQNLGYFFIDGTLSTGSTNYDLTKVGGNQISFINASVDPALGNIDVQQGMLNFQGTTSSMGNPASNITVRAGAILSFYDTTTPWSKNFILFGDGVTPTIWNYDGSHTIIGPVTLNGNVVFGGAPAGRGAPVSMTFDGPISGSGALIKGTDTNTVILAGTNTYVGTTTINGGGLLVDGLSSTNNITVANGGTFGGLGIVTAPVAVQAGGTLSPGDLVTPMATLVISNSLVLGGTNAMDVNKAGSVFTADLITNVTSLTFGGTLRLALTGDTIVANDAIKLFSFGTASGSFTAFDPPTPGDGLVWDQSTLRTDGTIRVSVAPASQPGIANVMLSGGQIIITGTNGSASGNYNVLASTNVALPLSNWTSIASGTFDGGGNFGFTNTVNVNVSRQFYIIQQVP